MVKLLRKMIFPKCLQGAFTKPAPNMYQLLWYLRELRDPEEDEVEDDEEDVEYDEDGNAILPDDDEEDEEEREAQEQEKKAAAAEKRGAYFSQLVALLQQLWALSFQYHHQDELQAALKVAVTFPDNLETCGFRLQLAGLMLRDAEFEAAKQVYESVNREYPRDPATFATAFAVAAIDRRLGNLQKAAELFK